MSVTVGAVLVAKMENPLKNLMHRGRRVELSALHLVQQASQLGIAGDSALEMTPCPRGGDREHLRRQVPPPPLLEQPLRLEVRPVLADLLPQRLDSLVAERLGEDDR